MAEDVYTLSFGRRLMQMQLPLLILASQRKPGLDYIVLENLLFLSHGASCADVVGWGAQRLRAGTWPSCFAAGG
eukprot:1140925-Pelagomonas_calceolata.AAC.1